jgi:hypothetical protein
MIPAHLQNRSLEQLRETQETIRCFLIAPVGEGYESIVVWEDGGKNCIAGFNYHRSETIIRRFPLADDNSYPKGWANADEKRAKAVPYCTRCGNWNFTEKALADASGSKGRVWERLDTGERADSINAFGPGAMWYAEWYKNEETGLYWAPGFKGDQPHPPLVVRTPGGDWTIDSRASNCTRPEDNEHRCWVQHGTPPNITVDTNGNTCHCGGGSIAQPNYHGFLRDGHLVKC